MVTAAGGSRWSRDELLIVLQLYHRIPFGQMHHRNPDVVAVAGILGRSPGAVAYKLANFAALDPALDRRGLGNYSKADEALWRAFEESPEEVMFEAESQVSAAGERSLLADAEVDVAADIIGLDRLAIVRARVSQAYFRRMVMARFDGTCCMTGLRVPDLLVASHIVRWADDPALRLRPENGLCLNALHDRAFEVGLLQIGDDLRVRVRDDLRDAPPSVGRDFLLRCDGAPLILPPRVSVSAELLRRHRDRFVDA